MVGTSILDLCVVLLGALKVDSCPARITLGPGLGVKAPYPYFPHQLAEQIPVQDMAPERVQSKVKSQQRSTSRGLGRGPPKRAGCPLPGLPRPDPGQTCCILCPVLSCPQGAQTLPRNT